MRLDVILQHPVTLCSILLVYSFHLHAGFIVHSALYCKNTIHNLA
jgi:hypothetical protein